MNINPYAQQEMSTKDFLEISYKLMRKKILRLLEIENLKVRGKLSLPLLKEKLEIISNVLEALKILTLHIDYTTDIAAELSNILTDFSILLTQANIAETPEEAKRKYDIVLGILDSFLL